MLNFGQKEEKSSSQNRGLGLPPRGVEQPKAGDKNNDISVLRWRWCQGLREDIGGCLEERISAAGKREDLRPASLLALGLPSVPLPSGTRDQNKTESP